MMATIYGVSHGSYSDWGLIGLFDSREKAEAARDYFKQFEDEINPELEEYVLNSLEQHVRQGHQPFRVYMYRDGRSEIESTANLYFYGTYLSLSDPKAQPETYIYGTVWAKDKEHAAKIANEKRVQLLASGEWK